MPGRGCSRGGRVEGAERESDPTSTDCRVVPLLAFGHGDFSSSLLWSRVRSQFRTHKRLKQGGSLWFHGRGGTRGRALASASPVIDDPHLSRVEPVSTARDRVGAESEGEPDRHAGGE